MIMYPASQTCLGRGAISNILPLDSLICIFSVIVFWQLPGILLSLPSLAMTCCLRLVVVVLLCMLVLFSYVVTCVHTVLTCPLPDSLLFADLHPSCFPPPS